MPRPYPKEFRVGAVAPAREGERPVSAVAKELGIAESCLRNWLRQDQVDRRERSEGVSSVEREELRRLRRENARLKQEKEILCHVLDAGGVTVGVSRLAAPGAV